MELCGLADTEVTHLTAALEQQAALNAMLDAWDAFVLASDLEGLLLDTMRQADLAEKLGPDGENQVDKATAEKFAQGAQGKADMASWLGSKGWNSTGRKSGKVKPHLPSALLREHLSSRTGLPRAIRPLARSVASQHRFRARAISALTGQIHAAHVPDSDERVRPGCRGLVMVASLASGDVDSRVLPARIVPEWSCSHGRKRLGASHL